MRSDSDFFDLAAEKLSGGSANAQASGIARGQATVSATAIGGFSFGSGGSATLSSGGLGPAVFGSSATGGTVTVSGTAMGGTGSPFGPSVSLISNGGVNDAIVRLSAGERDQPFTALV
jgi:hypothetical protein